MHSFSSGLALIASMHALCQQANSPRILGRIGLTPNGSLLTLGGICGMPGSSGVTRSGVCDDATSALSCGAGPAGGYVARLDDLFGSLAQRRGFRGTWPASGPAGPEQDADRAGRAEPVTGAQHPAVQRALISRLNGNCGRARLRVLGYHTYHHAWDATTIPSDPSGCRRARLRPP